MADSRINRTGAEALMPEDAASEIIQGAVTSSAVLQLGTRLPNMTRAQRRLPVLSALPMAYFNNAGADPSDESFKQVTKMTWGNKYIDAEEVSVIVPIPENVLEDAGYDIWGQVIPRVNEAIGALIDAAVFFGTNKPNIWPDGLVTQAVDAGNSVALGTGDDLYDDLLAEGGVIALVEEDGFFVNGHVADVSMRARLRGLRDSGGQPIFMRTPTDGQNVQSATRYDLDGSPIFFPRNGAWDASEALLLSGDFNQLVYAIRKDITYKLLDQAVIQDPSDGSIVYNLAQQDAVALRVVMRLGWQVPNPINRMNDDADTRFPFAVLEPADTSGQG